MEVRLQKASREDAEEILAMQKDAFSDLLHKYKDYDTSPANESLDKTLERLSQPYTYFYFIYAEGIKVGAIRIVDKKTEEPKIISPIFIQPKYRNRGYATSAVKEAERMHGEFGWELDTIAQEKETRRFYENLGYKFTGEKKEVNDKMSLVYYAK